MCWMAIYRGENALERAVDACREQEAAHGGDSWGVAIPTGETIATVHGLGLMPDEIGELEKDADIALAHTRLATRGSVTLQNAHPFPIKNEAGETIAALAHNGTWYDAPADGDRCDSYYIARLLEQLYQQPWPPDADFGELVEYAGQITGETITVIHRDGEAYGYAGRYDLTEAERAIKSSGGETITEGRVAALEV